MSAMEKPLWARQARKAEPVCRCCGRDPHMRGIDPDLAIAAAAGLFGVGKNAILSPSRADQLVTARAFATWVLRSLGAPMHYAKIGRIMGGRDHTTIINLHVKAILLRAQDEAFGAACARIEERFYILRGVNNASC